MKTYIPTPEEVYDGPRMPVTEELIAFIIELLPGPGLTTHLPMSPDALRDSPEWHIKQSIEEVEELFRLRGWQARVYYKDGDLEGWWLEITNPVNHGRNSSRVPERTLPQHMNT